MNDYEPLAEQARRLKGLLATQARRAFVLELTGTPKAGKTSTIRLLETFFKTCGWRVHVVKERAAECPIPMKGHFFFNTWTTCTMMAEVLEASWRVWATRNSSWRTRRKERPTPIRSSQRHGSCAFQGRSPLELRFRAGGIGIRLDSRGWSAGDSARGTRVSGADRRRSRRAFPRGEGVQDERARPSRYE